MVSPPQDPEALADAISWGADHRDDLEAMGYAVRRLAEDHYDRRHITPQFASLLTAVLEEPRRHSPEPGAKRRQRALSR